MELSQAILFVKDMDRMVGFYGGTLGLTLLREKSSDEWAELAAGGTTLALHAIPASIAASIVISDPPPRREDTPIKLVFRVDDLEAERARLVALGVTMREIQTWGACDGVDPEGNVFQIAKRR